MAQVNLDVVYNVKGMQALKQSQTAMNQAAMAARGSTNSVRGYSQALTTNAAAATKSGAANTVAAKGYRATGFAAVGASGGVKGFGVALSAALGPIAAVTGALALVGKTISVFSERQADVAVLANGLKNLGLQGTPALDALQASADKLGKTTLFDQEQFTRGYALLTSFKQIGVSSYERVATAAADLAQTTGQDLNGALMQLSKALEDPARRVTDLARSGTVFTEQQKEQIRVLQESGDILGAQAIVLAEIERQYGGAAEAAGSAGFAGAMDSLGEATRDLMEQLGKNLIPILTNVVKVISNIINLVNSLIGKLNELGLNKVFDFLMKPAEIFAGLMGDAAEQVDKTRQNAEGAAPAVADLKDQVLEMPKPVKETADNMDELKSGAEKVNQEALKTTELFKITKSEAAKTSEKIAKSVTEVQGLSTATSDASEKMASYAAKAGLSGDEAARVAGEAMKIYQNTTSASAAANTLAGAFAQVANEAQRAASASAGIGAGGGGLNLNGGGASSPHTFGTADHFILDDRGNIVRNPNYIEEQKANQKQRRLDKLNADATKAGLFDRAMQGSDYQAMARAAYHHGGIIGPKGSQLWMQYERDYGAFTRDFYAGPGKQPSYSRFYADGGYVTGPQQAVVGEGGEPEYIIPASKMDSAMQRYGSGMRGSSVIPDNASVSINYNGSTVDMGGTSYINKGDVNGIVSQAVNATLTTLKKSPRARLEAGMR